MAEPHSTDRLVRELTRLYGQAYQYTLERLADIIRRRRSSDYHRAVLAAIQGRLQELREQTGRWVLGGAGEPGRVATAWQEGAQSAAIDFARAGRPLSDRFVSPPREAIEITARNLLVSLDDAVRSTGQKAQAWITAVGILAQMDTAGPLGPGGFPLIGRRIDDVLRRAGLDATARKLTEGLTVRDMRKILLSDLVQQGLAGFTDQAGRRWTLPAYAEMVARTTSREAYTQGTLQVIRRTGHDLVRASTHWPTCPICASRQGRVYSLSGRTPGWPSLADVGPTPWHPNCFPPGVLVSGPAVLAHMARPYDGELVIIHTAGGNELPVTPNHPILTPKGWVASGALQEGDEVVQYVGNQRVLEGVNPDDVLVPTLIEDVASALWKPRGMATVRVPVSPEHFHGDGIGSKVCVIRTDGFLWGGFNASFSQPSGQQPFGRASGFSLDFSSSGPALQFRDAPFLTPDSSMRSAGLSPALLRGLAGRAGLASIGAGGSWHDARLAQTFMDGHLCDAQSAGDMTFRHPRLVEANNLLVIQGQPVGAKFAHATRPELTRSYPGFSKPHFESSLADTQDLSDLFYRLASLVQTDRVIHIERRHFSGQVYNLHTTEGWYVANNIVTHNCGHSVNAWFPEFVDPGEVEQLRDLSNRSLDADPRSRVEVEAYSRSQRINTLRRERRQLLAQRKEDLVPLDAHMRRWSEELQQPDLDPVRRRELQEKLAERAERWEQGRRQRLREVNAELRDLNREQRAAFRRRQGRPLPVGGGGGERSRRPLPGRRELARMSSADQRVQAIIEANLPDAQKLTALRSVRRAEVAQAPRDYIQATLQRAQGEKPIYRGSYHYRKHAPKFGLPVRQTVTNQDVDSPRKVLAEVRTHPDDVYTYYHDKSGRRQWLFVQRRPDGKSWAVVWDEGDDRDMSGWVYPTRQEYKNDVRLHRHWLKVR